MGKLDPYYRISKVTGLNVQLAGDGQVISLCSVEASGNRLDIIKRKTDITVLAQLKELCPSKTVIALNLSGKGILQRRIDRAEAIDAGIFSAILPNAKLEDFYVQNFISGEHSFVSVVRKSEADRWINGLGELGFEPLLLSLGVFPVEQILPQLNIYESETVIAGQLVARNQKGEWVDARATDTEPPFAFKLGSEKIDPRFLLPYAAAFQLVMVSQLDPIAADAEGLHQILESRLAEQKLKVQGALVLAAIFILLLANFILLSWLNSSNAALSDQVGKFAQTNNNEQEMAGRIKEKEALLHSLGWDGGVNKSVLIDQVASLLPPEVKLREIAVNPVDITGSRLEKGTVFYDRKLVISGNSEKIIPVNEWIARIETRAWVKHIRLENFSYNNELNTGQFTVSIDY
jgi:hypothetical protein